MSVNLKLGVRRGFLTFASTNNANNGISDIDIDKNQVCDRYLTSS